MFFFKIPLSVYEIVLIVEVPQTSIYVFKYMYEKIYIVEIKLNLCHKH